MIEIEHVTRRYGAKLAVDNLNLHIPRGELFAFLGPNGAGKTTTIKMLVGLLRPSSGKIRLCGHDVGEQQTAANRLLGYVPDVPYLYDKLSGSEFLRFIAEMYGIDAREADERIAEQIEIFKLHEFVNDLTESYSHGMKQRVAFAAAMLHDPQVLVIDEPMVGLDPRSVRVIKDMLRNKARGGQTIFMSTHLLSIAQEIADRVGIVDQGRLQFLGTIDELRAQVASHESSLEHLYLSFTAQQPAAQAAENAPLSEEPAG